MKMANKLRKIIKQEFHIVSDRQLKKALANMDELDIAIFTGPLIRGGKADEKKTT